MRCLSCSKEIQDAFFDGKSASPEFKGGRFSCPHCGAEHVRRSLGFLPSGAPLHTFRLWGHPLSTTRKAAGAPLGGNDRRSAPRVKPRR